MTTAAFKPKAYLIKSCPFCFKFLVFMGEAQLADDIDIVGLEANSQELEDAKATLGAASGAKVSFPVVEVEPGVYKTDSDQLIEYFAKRHGVNAEELPVLSFYKRGLFPAYINMYKEILALKHKNA